MQPIRRCPHEFRGGLLACAAVIMVIATCFASVANAKPACRGTYSATSLTPLPAHYVVQYNIGAQGPAITAAMNRFIGGLQQAGIVLTGAPTIQMNIAASVLPPRNAQGDLPQGGSYTGFGWAADTSPGAVPIIGSTMHLSITLTEIETATMNWLGDVTCTIATNDKAQLADELGLVIGRAIGQNFNQRQL